MVDHVLLPFQTYNTYHTSLEMIDVFKCLSLLKSSINLGGDKDVVDGENSGEREALSEGCWLVWSEFRVALDAAVPARARKTVLSVLYFDWRNIDGVSPEVFGNRWFSTTGLLSSTFCEIAIAKNFVTQKNFCTMLGKHKSCFSCLTLFSISLSFFWSSNLNRLFSSACEFSYIK